MLPLGAHVPAEGLKISALLAADPDVPTPPATITVPSWRRVAVCEKRAVVMVPVGVQLPNMGSDIHALASVPAVPEPPATITIPFVSSVAVFT
jgi:hypothetical protein